MTTLVLDDIEWISMFSGMGGLDEGIRAALGGKLIAVAEHEPPTSKVPKPNAPARVLAHRYPDVPNLGDVSLIDWAPWAGRPVLGVSAGFPCQDVSHAGLRNGMMVGNRSGLWYEVARAIAELRPQIVVIENVPGLRSARAGDPREITDEEPSDMEPSEEFWENPNGMIDLFSEHSVPYSATWPSSGSMLSGSVFELPMLEPRTVASAYSSWRTTVDSLGSLPPDLELLGTPRTSSQNGVGHYETDPRGDRGRLEAQIDSLMPTPSANLGDNGGPQHPDKRRAGGHAVSIEDAVIELFPTPSVAVAEGGQTSRSGDRSDEPLLGGIVESMVVFDTPDTNPDRPNSGSNRVSQIAGLGNQVGEIELLPTPSTSNREGNKTNNRGDFLLPGVAEGLLPTPIVGDAVSVRNSTAKRNRIPPTGVHAGDTLLDAVTHIGEADTLLPTPTTEPNTGNGHARDLAGELTLLPTPAASVMNDGEDAAQWQARADTLRDGAGTPLPIAVQQTGDAGPEDMTADGEPVRWGKYRAAIRRAQHVAGRLAPSPTNPDGLNGKRRLSARFVEFMMMLPYGWVTDVPGLTRREMLKMLGNGVVPPQASVACLILIDRVQQRISERVA